MIYFCCEQGRRQLVLEHPSINGIDSLEVVHREEPDPAEQQHTLRVFFIKPPNVTLAGRFSTDRVANAALVKISGGDRIRKIKIDWVELREDHLAVHVTPRGDFSTYSLQLVEPNSQLSLTGLDPRLARIDFSFKVECDTALDCRDKCDCPPTSRSSPDIDYLAKDFNSFQRMMLERLAVTAPSWQQGQAADIGTALVELLAYVGDYLSYRQDAIATEAYLGTARSRISVRRHACLLDYAMHDGCVARCWIQVRLTPDAKRVDLLPTDAANTPVRFATRLSEKVVLNEHEFRQLAAAQEVEVFEAMEAAQLFPEHNEFRFYDWGDRACCLPRGATKATLRGEYPNLEPGQVLILTERLGPRTGDAADADPAHRHAVRLTQVNGLNQREYRDAKRAGTLPQRLDHLLNPPAAVTDIEWSTADALPFPLSISTRTADGRLLEDVSIALGNIVLADHGLTLWSEEDLGIVPTANHAIMAPQSHGCSHCQPAQSQAVSTQYRPQLQGRWLTQAATYDRNVSATTAFQWTMREVFPAIRIWDSQDRAWSPKRDLLSSHAFALEFVVEAENDGQTYVRFGDDVHGMRPAEGTNLRALYRTGNGTRGNLGAGALSHLVCEGIAANDIESISNPMAARGGCDPEPLEVVRQNAPAAFRVQRRAVTAQDYADRAAEHPDVQRAAATLRWTGSWYTVYLCVDRRAGRPVDAAFQAELRGLLERYRLAGIDLEITAPKVVPLELSMRVCVDPGYLRSDVVAALHYAFDNRIHTDGSRGFFHPDQFTFGQPVQLSQIYALAHRIAGVQHLEVTLLRRYGDTLSQPLPENDVLITGRTEIIRLDNDPNYPDRGLLRIEAVGGR